MTRAQEVDQAQALQAVEELIHDHLRAADGRASSVLCLAGPPRSGKTTFAREALLLALRAFGDSGARLLVSGRHAADQLSLEVIARRGVSGQTRPVGTLQALAFQLLSQAQLLGAEDQSAPRLLNGAEQDALLRSVMARHIGHVQAGDDCPSCRLLERYFAAQTGWSTIVTKPQDSLEGLADHIDDDFIAQLRDMLARMTELGLDPLDQDPVLDALAAQDLDLDARDRLSIQWRLAFALWGEYLQEVGAAYPGENRLDPSMLLVVARQALAQQPKIDLPRLLVVDDWQDLTMAGMSLLQTLQAQGTRLVLVGNSDESVQAFRGSYPEFLAARVGQSGPVAEPSFQGTSPALPPLLPQDLGCLGAVCMSLPYRPIVTAAEHSQQEDAAVVGDQSEAQQQAAKPVDATGAAERPEPGKPDEPASYADLLAARVSLSILNEEGDSQALFDRPGKMPHWAGTMPIVPLEPKHALLSDQSVLTRLFHTRDEEEDDIVWQVKHEFLSGHWDWNNMAILAHDNATVRAIGHKLRVEGVPVRYSSIARPLKEEPAVQGLFALLDLAQAQLGVNASLQEQSAVQEATWVRERLNTLLTSPLLEAELPGDQESRPVRVSRLDALLGVLIALTRIDPAAEKKDPVQKDPVQGGTAAAQPVEIFNQLQHTWQDFARVRADHLAQIQAEQGVSVDDSLLQAAGPAGGASTQDGGSAGVESGPVGQEIAVGQPGLSADAVYLLLLLNPSTPGALGQSGQQVDSQAAGASQGMSAQTVPSKQSSESDSNREQTAADSTQTGLRAPLLAALKAVANTRRQDPDLRALERALSLVDRTAQGLAALTTNEPAYALWQAWQAAGVADAWQSQSLEASWQGEQANDRLDAMMRLFQFATSSQSFDNVNDFMAQVQGMQIEADSLAHVGPVEHAVTLTTPAGAAALAASWPLVWLPSLQEGLWPNLAPRDTLFGGEDLADLMLYGHIRQGLPGQAGSNPRLKSTLYAEEKGLLMALTRARQQLRLSAMWNDDTVPSDFLYGFLPEYYPRLSDASEADFTQVGADKSASSLFSGLEVGPRGLVAAARSILTRQALAEGRAKSAQYGQTGEWPAVDARSQADAVASLQLLQEHGFPEANPANWPFVYASEESSQQSEQEPEPVAVEAEPVDQLPAALSPVAQTSSLAQVRESESPAAGPNESVNASSGQGRESATNPNEAVTLSPSAVDNIWRCPLEWVMDNQFSGPEISSVAAGFGSLIHQVAQEAANQGLDRPDRGELGSDAEGGSQIIARTTDQMMDIYRQLQAGLPDYATPEDAYNARRQEAQARSILGNIASYFVLSSQEDYAQSTKLPISVGRLVGAEQEVPFRARFQPADLTAIWNRTYPEMELDDSTCFALASGLVGGFPQALQLHTAITLSGRIDRLEHREIDSKPYCRLVDYKTGRGGTQAPRFLATYS
ncbi:hypothetical protein KIM372_13170 [Bombiscardovia nodaiensis]|uniref:UvrD-like helicase ATP-binding domain-containing protein n=1 Tax=Bombiscardovia nodaiensis TaxID=2932181 RepID=A0ABN6SF47_9BIFI|nr:hypothetical protein KIM372_13170 [Bombiscardovia nodaiensis]